MKDKYVYVIKRRDLDKLESLVEKSKVELLSPTICFKVEKFPNGYTHYVWPRSWGIRCKKDGYLIITSEKLTKDLTLQKLNLSIKEIEDSFVDPNLIYKIDEETFSNN